MHPLVTLITQEYNPEDCNFIRADASDLLAKIQQTPEQLDQDWDVIFDELRDNNIFIQPALPDVVPGESVRIFRADGPLGQVILEALVPTANGDKLMAQAISKLNRKSEGTPRPGRNGQARKKQHGGGRHFQKLPPKRDKDLGSSLARNHSGDPPDPTHVNKSSHYIRPLE
jgi:hypothetical protein